LARRHDVEELMASTTGATGRISGLLDSVPGYRGYRNKEERRDADRRVRERVAAAFAAQADRVERIARDLANQRRLRDIGPVDEFARAIRYLVDRISTATYGYGGLFGDRNVDEAALDQLRLFDEGLMSGVGELEGPIAALEQAFAANGDLAPPARDGAAATRKILSRLDLRNEVIETGKPAPQEKIKDILSPKSPDEQGPPPAYDMQIGDALTILGDNFIVDGRIDLQAGGHGLRLLRVGTSPERWLAVPEERGASFALLDASDQDYAAGTESTIGGTSYTVNWSSAGTGEVTGKGGSTGSRPVTVSDLTGKGDAASRAVVIDWGSEGQVLVGKEVHPDDVEIFGATGNRR
jgi:hypothetical protein